MTKDAVLDRAVDLAREACEEIAEEPGDVGEHLGATWEADRLVTHRFACTARGYRGWQWTVTVARVPRGRSATVCEAVLLPGDGALLARPWVPWAERLRPGDLGVGDVLPFRPDDPRLEPGWRPSGDPDADDAALVPVDELALARERVLAPLGRNETAARWYRGAHGPTSAGALAATAACATCGFLVLVRGALGQVFGVCANEWSPDDGTVVSVDHGCGAHSQTDVDPEPSQWPAPDPLIDDSRVDVVAVERAEASDADDSVASDETAASPEAHEPVEAEGLVASDEAGSSAEVVAETTSDVVPDEPAPTEVVAETTPDVVPETADGPVPAGVVAETTSDVVPESADEPVPTGTVTDDEAPEPVDEASADPSSEG